MHTSFRATFSPHPEEPRACAASRRMAAGRLWPILRDAAKEAAPQDEGSVGLVKIAGGYVHALVRRQRRPPTHPAALLASPSNPPAVICPVQQSLALSFSTQQVTRLTMSPDLRDVPPHRLPARDLTPILMRHAAAHGVAAIPLKPPTRVIGMYPSLSLPDRQRLASVDAEIVQRRIAPVRRQPDAGKPTGGKFVAAIGHVLAAEYAEGEHLPWRQLRMEFRIEASSGGSVKRVDIAALHPIVYNDGP
jgi:hypothetical protein